MPIYNTNLYNKTRWQPGASIRSTVESEGDVRAKHFNLLVVIGPGVKRGDPSPEQMHKFNSPSIAKETLGTGVVYDLMKHAWSPSSQNDVFGANYIGYIRPGDPTQGSLVLTDGSNPVGTITTVEYGANANYTRAKVTNASNVSGAKCLTIAKLDDEGKEQILIHDDLKNAFQMQYTGSGSAATLTIAKTGDTAVTLTTSITGVDGDNISMDLTDTNFQTLASVVNYINSQSSYNCYLDDYADPLMTIGLIDGVTAQDIKTSAYTHTAVLGSIEFALDTYNPLVTFARYTGATAAPQNINYTYFTGGTDNGGDAIDTNDYIDALTELEKEAIGKGALLIQSESEAVHSAVASWAKTQRENDQGRWHVFVGHSTGESVLEIGRRANRINNKDVTLASPGIKLLNDQGSLTLYSSVYLAAMYAGQYVGSGLEQPLTNNSVPIAEVETKYKDSEVEYLIQQGVTVTQYDRAENKYAIIFGLTTYTQDESRFNRVLFTKGLVDHVEWGIKTAVESRFKGKKVLSTTAKSIESYVLALLRSYEVDDKILSSNPADPSSKAFSTPSVSVSGGISNIGWSAYYLDEIDHFNMSQKISLQKIENTVSANLL